MMRPEQRAILAFVVEDADAWYDNCVKTHGEEWADAALDMKVQRWMPLYLENAAAGRPLTWAGRNGAPIVGTPPELPAIRDPNIIVARNRAERALKAEYGV